MTATKQGTRLDVAADVSSSLPARIIDHPRYDVHLPDRPGVNPAIKQANDTLFTALAHFIATVPLDRSPYPAEDVSTLTTLLTDAAALLPNTPSTSPALAGINQLLWTVKRLSENPVITYGNVICGPLQKISRILAECGRQETMLTPEKSARTRKTKAHKPKL